MGRAGRLAGAAAFAVLCGRSLAAETAVSPANFLVQAAHAASTSNFEGNVIFRGGSGISSLRVIHRFARGHESEHVMTLDGPPRELLQEDDRVTWILPREEPVSFARPAIKGLLHGLTAERLNELAPYYSLEDLGTERVAGRTCRGVSFRPTDPLRYGYQLWAEQTSHIPLKVTLVGADGSVLEQLMFTQLITPRTIPDAAFKPLPHDRGDFKRVIQQLTLPGADPGQAVAGRSAPRWRLGRLPPGFRVTLHNVRRMPHESDPVDHTQVSDGLSAISIFSAKVLAGEPGLQGLSHSGAINAYGRVVGDEHVTVVGEAPAEAVRMIGESLVPMQASAGPVTGNDAATP